MIILIRCNIVFENMENGIAQVNENFSIKSIKNEILELFPELNPNMYYLYIIPENENYPLSNILHTDCTIVIAKKIIPTIH